MAPAAAVATLLVSGLAPSLQAPRREFVRQAAAACASSSAFLTCARPVRAAASGPSIFANDVIGFSFAAPTGFSRSTAGGLFGQAAERLAFGGSVTFNGPDGAAVELTTQTLPPGPQYTSVDAFGSIEAAADRIVVGQVLAQRRARMGEQDAFIFESQTDTDRGFTAVALKKVRHRPPLPPHPAFAPFPYPPWFLRRMCPTPLHVQDVNFANHMVVLSAHAPIGASWDAQRDALRGVVDSLELKDLNNAG